MGRSGIITAIYCGNNNPKGKLLCYNAVSIAQSPDDARVEMIGVAVCFYRQIVLIRKNCRKYKLKNIHKNIDGQILR